MERRPLERMMQDLRFAWRLQWRSPGFAAVALCTLALGIGATTAIFTVVNAVVLRPLAFPEPDELVMVWERPPGTDWTRRNVVQTQNFLDWHARNRSFEGLAALIQIPMTISGSGDAEQMLGLAVSGDFFRVLGITPLLGRGFGPGEDVPGGPPVVVLGHRIWQQRFGGDPRVLGRAVTINGTACEVIGVMPADFSFPVARPEFYTALRIDPKTAPIEGRNYRTVARLKPGVTLAVAQAEMNTIAEQTARERPKMNEKWGALVLPLHEQVTRDIRPALAILFGAVVGVLLIACVNIANLLSMRSAARTRRDVAVRVALGASRAQLTRDFLAESLLLCLAGGAAGVLIASWLVRGLLTLMPPTMFVQEVDVALDARVLVFAGVLSTATGVIFGLLPTLTFARADLRASGLNVWGSTSGGGASRPFARHALLVGEVALTLTLVSGSTLLLGSLVRLLAIDPGFRTARTVALNVTLDRERYGSIPAVIGYQDEMLARIRALPGVASAAVSNLLPLAGRNSMSGVWIVSLPGSRTGVGQRFVSADYFSTMGITLMRGRVLASTDSAAAPPVVVINETYARVLGRFRDPLGAELQFQGRPATVVGIVRDVKHRDLTSQATNELFAPLAQAPQKPWFLSQLSFVVQTTERPAALVRALTQIAGTADPNVAVVSVRTLDEYLTESIARPRFLSALFGLFGALALGLTAVGIYGVLSSFVSERTRELAIRLALGAQRQDVLRLVMRTGIAVTLVGVTLGLVGALLVGRALSSLLFEVSATDPRLYGGAGALLAAVALIACWLPARRATKSDPLVVLRAER